MNGLNLNAGLMTTDDFQERCLNSLPILMDGCDDEIDPIGAGAEETESGVGLGRSPQPWPVEIGVFKRGGVLRTPAGDRAVSMVKPTRRFIRYSPGRGPAVKRLGTTKPVVQTAASVARKRVRERNVRGSLLSEIGEYLQEVRIELRRAGDTVDRLARLVEMVKRHDPDASSGTD